MAEEPIGNMVFAISLPMENAVGLLWLSSACGFYGFGGFLSLPTRDSIGENVSYI